MPRVFPSLTAGLQEELDHMAGKNEKAILIAFGSTLNMSPETLPQLWNAVTRALDSKLVHRVYWSIGKGAPLPKETHPQVQFMDWSPQQAMLNHPAMSLFVTHGGAESIHEAIYGGVPMLAIPFFGDQPGNAVRVAELNIARTHSKFDLNEYDVYQSIVDIIEDRDGQIQKSVQSMKYLARSQSKRGIQHAVDLIETIAEVGSDHLLPTRRSLLEQALPQWDVMLALVFFSFISFKTIIGIFSFLRRQVVVFSKLKAE
jgi:UDP:flavonoid glycosyltransferase YjiC (YdhE family)